MAHEVFISHSAKDKVVADAVCASLESAGVRCWVAPRDVQPGVNFAGQIKRAISGCTVFVLIFSGNANISEHVLREVELAARAGRHIVSFRLETVTVNDDLDYYLSTPHWLDAVTPPLEAHLDRLSAAVRALLRDLQPALQHDREMARLRRERDLVMQQCDALRTRFERVVEEQRELLNDLHTAMPGAPPASAETSRSEAQMETPMIVADDPSPPEVPTSETETAQPVPVPVPTHVGTPAYSLLTRRTDTDVSRCQGKTGEFGPFAISRAQWIKWVRAIVGVFAIGYELVTRQEAETERDGTGESDKRIVLRLRHDGSVEDAQFSVDGSRIVTGSADKTARVWEATTGKPVGEPLRHKSKVKTAQFSPDGSLIATDSDADDTRVWETGTGRPVGQPLRHADYVRSVQFSPDGSLIVTAAGGGFSTKNEAQVWEAATGKPLGELLRHEDVVHSAQFSPNGSRIVTASSDRTARVWEATTGKFVGVPLHHEDSVLSAWFSPDGSRIVTASFDKTAQVWETATSKAVGEPLRHEGVVHSAQFSPDGIRVVTACDDGIAKIWSVGK